VGFLVVYFKWSFSKKPEWVSFGRFFYKIPGSN